MAEKSSSQPIQITLPFLKTTFPELGHLPVDEQQAILQKCIEAESLKAISRQSILINRILIVLLAAGAVVGFIAVQLSATSWALFYLLWATMAAVIVGVIASFFVYHIRSSRELKRLILQELYFQVERTETSGVSTSL